MLIFRFHITINFANLAHTERVGKIKQQRSSGVDSLSSITSFIHEYLVCPDGTAFFSKV